MPVCSDVGCALSDSELCVCVCACACACAHANKLRRTARVGVNIPDPDHVNYFIAFPRDSLHLSRRTSSCHFHTRREIMMNMQCTHIHTHP